jgi:hypothetical protein
MTAESAEPALTALASLRNPADVKTYAALSELSSVPASTLWHRSHGRQSRKESAVKRQYLTPSEEKALVDYILRLAERGYPVPVKFLQHLAWTISRQRSSVILAGGLIDSNYGRVG